MKIGYMRPYYEDLECKQQKELLLNQPCDHVFEEKHASAKKRNELEQLLSQLKRGDKVIVQKLYVLADSTRHLLEILQVLDKKGVFLYALTENIDTSMQEGYSFQTIVNHLVAFQSDVISEKTKKGLHQAKQKGNTPGRPRKPDANVRRAIQMYESKKYSLQEITKETGISKSTLYRYLES